MSGEISTGLVLTGFDKRRRGQHVACDSAVPKN